MDSHDDLIKINLLIDKDKAADARVLFEKLEKTASVDYFLTQGKIEQKFQNWGNAINAYNKVLEIEPANLLAKNNLELIHNILNFWNPEMFNP